MIQLTADHIEKWLEEVKDPEIPVLSVLDMGIVRAVSVEDDTVEITITPTYSGCPAMDVIAMDIRLKLIERGIRNVRIHQQLSPAWTTDWISADGLRKLREFGIAPPVRGSANAGLFEETEVACPRCGSGLTELISEFSSTACKSMYRCLDCREAFDHFKCH